MLWNVSSVTPPVSGGLQSRSKAMFAGALIGSVADFFMVRKEVAIVPLPHWVRCSLCCPCHWLPTAFAASLQLCTPPWHELEPAGESLEGAGVLCTVKLLLPPGHRALALQGWRRSWVPTTVLCKLLLLYDLCFALWLQVILVGVHDEKVNY